MAKQQKRQSHPIADQFNDAEMDAIKRYGQALGGSPTAFEEEVEKRLSGQHAREKALAKKRAAQTGGPRRKDSVPAISSRNTKAQSAQAQRLAAQQAQLAQAQQAPVNAPPAPTGAAGTIQPYQTQAGPQV